MLEFLEERRLLNVDWRNPVDSLDVDSDGFISPLDALININYINSQGSGSLPVLRDPSLPFFDIDGDQTVSPLDVLSVVNHLNSDGGGQRDLNEFAGQLAQETAVTITLGQTAGTREYRVRIESKFDTTDNSAALEDLLAVYLVDPQNPATTLLDRGANGTALFTLAGTAAEFVPGRVRWDGSVLTINLSELSTVDTGVLKFQLISSDNDSRSKVTIVPLTNQVDAEGRLGPEFPNDDLSVQAGVALTLANLVQVPSSSLRVSNVRFQSSTGRYEAEMSLRNDGESLGREVAVVFPGLPAGVTLRNPSGTTVAGEPYINLKPAIERGGLTPNSWSRPVRVEFDSPSRTAFVLKPKVLAGTNHAPTLDPIPPLTVMPGGVLDVSLIASDQDNDSIFFSLVGAVGLPTGTLAPSGTLTFRPTPSQLGTYQFNVVASDGALETTRPVTLNVIADPITTTRVSGRVLNVDETPISGLVVEIGGVQGLTQTDGRFALILGNGPLVSETLKVRGETYNDPSGLDVKYPFIAEKLPFMLGREVYTGFNNVLHRPIYLPKLNPGAPVNPTENTVISATLRQDQAPVEVEITAGTLFTQQGTLFTGNLSITEVPPSLTPAALPPNLRPDFLVTIQPGEMVFSTPAPLTFPNTAGWATGTLMDLWSINPVTGEFDIVGQMQVSSDGETIETISGGIRNSSWHFPAIPNPSPKLPDNDPNTPKEGCKTNGVSCATATSAVLLHSGALMESHSLVSYNSLGQSRELTLTYDSLRADPRPIVHFGYANLVGGRDLIFALMQVQRGNLRAIVPGYVSQENNDFDIPDFRVLSGEDGKHFWSNVIGDLDIALQADFRSYPSGRYGYDLEIGRGITLRGGFINTSQGPRENWDLLGTSTRTSGKLISVNSISSPFGAGWGLNGLQQLIENPDGSVLRIDGNGSEELFEPDGAARPYRSPPGDFSQLEKLANGSYQQTFPDERVLTFNTLGMLASIADRNGNTTRYVYGPDELLQKIVDPAGQETRFTYMSGRLDTVTDPAGRITRMQYDNAGNLTRITDPDGSFRTFVYDAQHHMVGEVDQLGRSEQAQYGFHGRVTSATRKDGSTVLFDPVQVQGLLPPHTTSDPFRPADGSSQEDAVAKYTDGQGNVFTATLDRAGQEISSSDGLGNRPVVSRNEANLVTSSTDARGFVSEFTYDTRGNLMGFSDDIIQNSGSSSSHLFPGERFATGVRPLATAAGDFNGDGFSDLITANRDSGDLSILIGNGDGTFAPERRISTVGSPQAVMAGDVNGDGLLDLAIASYAGLVAVMLGAGDGTFSAPRIISTDRLFTSVTMGDFDQDGDVDIAAAGFYGTVFVMLGRGDGLFANAQEFAVGFGVSSLTAGDFNNDGAIDLATSNGGNGFHSGSTVSILLGNGDGTFADQQTIGTGLVPLSVTTGDFNGDGILDLATPNYGDGWSPGSSVSVLTGLGDGSFSAPESFPVGRLPQSIIIGDFNGDGLLDLATANSGSQDVSVLLSHGNGTFAEPLNFSAGTSPGALTAADFNGDGTLDLAIPNLLHDVVTVLLGNGDGTLAGQKSVEVGYTPRSIVTDDFNGDGILDLAVANFGDPSQVTVRLGLGGGEFGVPSSYPTANRSGAISAGDFNGDGFVDLVTSNGYGSSSFSVLLGNGNGTFRDQIRIGGGSSDLALGDFNGDEILDLASEIALYLGVGDGTFEFSVQYGGVAGRVVAADFHGDGALDLVTAASVLHTLSIIMGTGDGNFSTPLEFGPGVSGPTALATGDFNGDGTLDLAVGGNFDADGRFAIFLGSGDGSFMAGQTLQIGSTNSIEAADFNGDGVLDLAIAHYDSSDLVLLLGKGDGTFQTPIRYAAGRRPSAVTSGDFNGDGLLDLAVANQDSADVSVLLANPRQGIVSPPTFIYEETFNQLKSATDELGRQTLFAIDPTNGNRLATRQVIGRLDNAANGETDDLLTNYTYTTFGLLDTVTDPLGRVTDYDYDPLGRLVATTFAVGTADQATANFDYDTAGNLIASIDELGHRTQLDYDSMNRLTRLVEPDPDGAGPLAPPITAFAYDTRGNLIETTDAGGSTSQRQYDPLDRPVLSRDHLGNETRFAYDPSDNLVSATDPNNHTTRYRYDARNRLTHLTDPDGGVTTFRYDLDDNLLALTDPVGNRTIFGYDSRDRLTFEVDPLGNRMRYAYDAVNKLTTKTDRSDRKTNFAYDELNRLIKETWVTGGNEIQYAYDKASNLTSVVDAFSSLAFTYDNRDRVEAVDNAGTPGAPRVVLDYAYDDVGNVLSVVDTISGSSGATTNYL